MGTKRKADESLLRTQKLNEDAQKAKEDLTVELSPNLERSKLKIDEIKMKNKATKQSVEGIIR